MLTFASILLIIFIALVLCLIQVLYRIERHIAEFKYDYKRINANKYYKD